MLCHFTHTDKHIPLAAAFVRPSACLSSCPPRGPPLSHKVLLYRSQYCMRLVSFDAIIGPTINPNLLIMPEVRPFLHVSLDVELHAIFWLKCIWRYPVHSSYLCPPCRHFYIPVAPFTKEVNSRIAKRPLKTNGRLANLEFTSLVKRGHKHALQIQVLNDRLYWRLWGTSY